MKTKLLMLDEGVLRGETERMEAEYCNEPPRSSEEEDKLGRSVKKFKESNGVKQPNLTRNVISYKDSLVGDIPGAYEQAFKLDNVWDDGEESDTEMEPLIEGMADVKLSKETKARIRAPWSKALIVKVFGRTVGFSYLSFKLNALWKPATRMDCVNLGKDYFLIKFHCTDDYDKVLRGGPRFIGEHFLAIKPWEPYFRASGDSLKSVAVCVRFLELPIEFYDMEVLKEIGSAIGPVLRIDSYTATGSRGSYARLCIQIDLDKPLINSIRIGRLVQQVKYEGKGVWLRVDGPDLPLGVIQRDVNPKGRNVQRGDKLEGSSVLPIKERVLSTQSKHTHAMRNNYVQVFAPNEDLGNLEIRFSASSPKQGEGVTQTDGKLQMGFSSSGTRSNRSYGGKSSKSLKRQHPSSSASSQKAGSRKTLQKREFRGMPCGSKQSNEQSKREWLGDLASEQVNREYLPNHAGESKNRENFVGSSDIGTKGQSLVELHNRRAFNFLEGVRSLEQAEKAIGGASLRRIQKIDPGEEVSGPEGYGYDNNGESPNADANSDPHPGGEVRCFDKLQGRSDGNTKVLDDMETGMEALKGFVEEAGMEHGGSCSYES
nr:hypothetical protein CFP56_48473 [Quercus suber]